MVKKNRITRRGFLKQAAGAAALGAAFPYIIPASARRADAHVAPSNRVTVGCIGVGPQGNGVMGGYLNRPDAQVVAVCDVKRPCREDTKARVDKRYGDTGCAMYTDFRELLARADIDAVSIASTDHWHVLHALYAVRAGKDTYVEKPLGLSLAEEIALRNAVQQHGRVFQFGTQQRSSRNFRFACELVRNGRIGQLHTIRVGSPASIPSDVYPTMPVPDWVDYDLWLGPAPWAPYTDNRISNSHWWHISDYALGFVAGWGIHHVDIAQWGNGTDDTGPVEIEGSGVFPAEGMCDCATAWNVSMKYANGVTLDYTDEGKNTHGILFEGSEGQVYVRRSFMDATPKSLLDSVIGPDEIHLYESDDHQGNFIDCVKSRAKTVCPIEVTVRSDTLCHLSDIAMRLGRKLRWDPRAERFIDDEEANRRLTRAMRAPWRLV